jgi:hypothetical protein
MGVLRTETGNWVFPSQIWFLLPDLEYFLLHSVLVNPEPEFQFLVPFPADIGFHQITWPLYIPKKNSNDYFNACVHSGYL